jgi:hypothetical protein
MSKSTEVTDTSSIQPLFLLLKEENIGSSVITVDCFGIIDVFCIDIHNNETNIGSFADNDFTIDISGYPNICALRLKQGKREGYLFDIRNNNKLVIHFTRA